MDLYPCIKTELLLRKFEGASFDGMLTIGKNRGPRMQGLEESTFKINSTASTILSKVDGTKTLRKIADEIAETYAEDAVKTAETIADFLDAIQLDYGVEIDYLTSPAYRPVKTMGYENIYPSQVTLELTSRCNHRCLHCYGDYGCGEDAPLEGIGYLLDSMSDLGIMSMEISGGEPTVHPDLPTVIDMAFDRNFSAISLLTNGYSLSEELLETIVRHKDQISVQIDLHSLNDAYYKWFTGCSDALKQASENALKLIHSGIRTFISCIATPNNLNELNDIARWAHENKAAGFRLSPVIGVGRAADPQLQSQLMFTTEQELETYFKIFAKIYEEYPHLSRYNATARQKKQPNCGVFVQHCVVGPNGKMKLCGMQTDSDFAFPLGNAFEKRLADIYNENADFVRSFSSVEAPHFDSEACEHCEHRHYCSDCLYRGLSMANRLREDCAWYSQSLPNLIKEKLEMR